VKHYGRGLIDASEDLYHVGQKLKGQIPAVIREVVERAKLAALAHGDDLHLRAFDLGIAADGMLAHLKLLQPRPQDNRTAFEKFAATIGQHIENGLQAPASQPALAAIPLSTETERSLNGSTAS
jgi:transitional endoplasmic reticulum ATPase